MLTQKLNSPALVPQHALAVYQRLRHAGHTCLLAGGWVRDLCMGHPSDDVDLATSATPEEMLALFDRALPLGQRFGSVVVIIHESGITHTVEVTTFRKDGEYFDGRRPSMIHHTDPEEDAQRRDFTINGLFFDPQTQEIIDWVGGLEDIKCGVIRAIGHAMQRFQEDRLRLLRAVRFASRFNFSIDSTTQEAIKNQAPFLMECVSVERILQELTKMHQGGHLEKSLRLLLDLGLLEQVFGLQISSVELQNRLRFLSEFKAEMAFWLAALWPISMKEGGLDSACFKNLEKLKISRHIKNLLTHLDEGLKLQSIDPQLYERLTWVRWISQTENMAQDAILWIASRRNNPLWKKSIEQLATSDFAKAWSASKAVIKMQDLQDFGLQRGPALGVLLNWLHEEAARMDVIDVATLIRHLLTSSKGLQLLQHAQTNIHGLK